MVPSLFPPQNFRKQLFTAFLVLLFPPFTLFSQTVIKERVGINPTVKLSAATTEDYSPIRFQFGGPRPFNFVIESPSGTVSGSNAGWGAPFSVIEVSAVNGNYKVTVSSSCECQTNVGYSVTWIDPGGYTNWIAGYEMWFYGPSVREDRFTFNRVPPLPPPSQDNIKISMAGEKSIWPELPPGQSHIAGYNPRTNIKVKATNGNQPLANQNVKISITRIEGTGGHDHVSPALEPSKSGTIKVGNSRNNPQLVVTDSNGEYTTEEILASEFGGKYIIEAALVSKPEIKDTINIVVKVPNLYSLPLSEHYELIGTREHHLCQSNIPTSLHNANHFGEQKLISAITKLASAYHLYSNNEKIHVNDMSIEYGGKFDTNNLWYGDHAEHRTGKNVDLAFKTSNNQNECLPVNKRLLKELVVKYSDGRLKIHNDHYHMRII
ncbi:MAG: penicillin-insensitive murein endopeptidase [Bacteroidetes bacterium]|nr:penicillin-insensitive murein endopeptidase [Bacteroidota bacterium]MCL6098936.1 penicillin-insensitive murein endopeptidase [Bacteroidota bacterium]